MVRKSSYKILGLEPGADKAGVKKAYRRLAKKYHPDVNATADAAEKFLEITRAYDELLGAKTIPHQPDRSYDKAEQIIRREREEAKARERAKAWEKAKAREKARVREKAKAWERKRVRQEEEADRRFRESGWYDVLVLSKFAWHLLLLTCSLAAIVIPVILGLLIEPAAFLATVYFVVIGVFGLWHIYSKRNTWFRLGPLNTNREKFIAYLKKIKWMR